MTLLCGDCRNLMPMHGPYDLILADPPYGETSLSWDRRVDGWMVLAAKALTSSGSLWVFGSLSSFMATEVTFRVARLWHVQEIVWEKQNGSVFHADRLRRVHELVVQFSPASVRWQSVYQEVATTDDALVRVVRRKRRPLHTGAIASGTYRNLDGGSRLARSVQRFRNVHGRAIHPTEKPVALLDLPVRASCPPNGLVGDWFAGSAAAGVARRLAGRRYVGCKIDPDMAQRARDRLAAILPFPVGKPS